jgi:hypothetical protein
MKLLEARVNGNPRQVSTKYGDKSVLDVVTSEGDYTIWRPAGDMEVMGRMNGERVSITLDSKGKASLVEHASTKPQQADSERSPAMGFNVPTEQPSRAAEIVDYIQRLGKLYSCCLTTAANMPTSLELESTAVKDIATTMFIQTVRHFSL